jgi:hypothetical protein
VPGLTFQYTESHLAHFLGLPSARRVHSWPHRKHRQRMDFGIVILAKRLTHLPGIPE